MSDRCKISVVMPTYNGERYVEETLRSLEGQGALLFEVLLLDDGSSDRTVEIARRFQERLPLRILQRERVGNWVVNTNAGICESRGDFVTILHQDDLWLPGRLARFAETLALHPATDVFLNSSHYIDQRGQVVGPWSAPLRPNVLLRGEEVREKLIVQNFISMPGPIFKRSLLLPELTATGAPLDVSLWYTADWTLWLTLTERGSWFYHAPPLSCFRVHPESITAKAVVDEHYRNQLLQVVERFLPLTDATPGAPYRRQLADFSIAVNMFLASVFSGRVQGLIPLLRSAVQLGPRGLWDYCDASRIHQRLWARLRTLVGFKLRSLLTLPRCTREVTPGART